MLWKLCAPLWVQVVQVKHLEPLTRSLLTPLILLRVIRGWDWSQHCARQPWKAMASLPHTLLSVRPQKRNFRTAIYSDNDNENVDTTVQPVDFDPVAVRQHIEHHCYLVSKKRFSFYSWSWNNSLEVTALRRSPMHPRFLFHERPANEPTHSGVGFSHYA